MDMTFGTWNVRRLCRAGSLKTVARELAKHLRSRGSTRGHMGKVWQSACRWSYEGKWKSKGTFH